MNRTEDLYPQLLGHKSTIDATYHVARMAIEMEVPGDFVECGVYAGAQSAAMARAIMYGARGHLPPTDTVGLAAWRRVHLFDSFAGFPDLTSHDADMIAGGWKAGDTACPLEAVQANMKRWQIPDQLLVYHKGWFADTMPQSGIGRIAVLRLDGDLYESTKTAMQYLRPLVSPGGWIIVDDWNLDGCQKAMREFGEPLAPVYYRIPQ